MSLVMLNVLIIPLNGGTWNKHLCAVMPVSANGLGISLGFTRFLNKNKSQRDT